jgi:hypothetical protein
MTPSRIVAMIAIGIAVILAAAACSDAEARPTTSEYLAEANSACDVTGAEMDALFEELWAQFDDDLDASDPAQAAAYVKVMDEFAQLVIPVIEEGLDHLASLDQPEGGHDGADSYIAAAQDDLKDFDEAINAALDNPDPVVALDLLTDQDPFYASDRWATTEGLAACVLAGEE